MENLILKCGGIDKSYGKKNVLQGLDLTLEPGKIYGLVGRNGAGKTTLLSVITAQNPANGGTVTLNGESVWENEKAMSKICFSREIVASTANGIAGMKAKAYIAAAAMFYPDWDKEMADRLIKEFDLDINKSMLKLSKGMLSMVTIIVALASKAPFTILDEPVAGLDVFMRRKFYNLILEEFSDTHRTFIISTHIIEEASDVLEEVIMLHKGKVVLRENTQELLEKTWHVSGIESEVDKAVAGLKVYGVERTGRGKGVTVILEKGQKIKEGYDVTIQPMNLSNAFMAICGDGEA